MASRHWMMLLLNLRDSVRVGSGGAAYELFLADGRQWRADWPDGTRCGVNENARWQSQKTTRDVKSQRDANHIATAESGVRIAVRMREVTCQRERSIAMGDVRSQNEERKQHAM
eukprot:594285-Rhodomonas_salina.1